VVASSTVAAAQAQTTSLANGFQAITGRAATDFALPSDVQLAGTWRDARHDLTYKRYQQFAQPHNAFVEGGQLTVVQRGAKTVAVVGAHYGSVGYSNRLVLTGAQAASRATELRTGLRSEDGSIPSSLDSTTQLRVDPSNGRLFQRVDSSAPGTYVVTEVDAETGAIIERWDAINNAEPGKGTGVKGDRKSLIGPDQQANTSDDLTKKPSSVWQMQSTDNRLVTYDANHSGLFGLSLFNDNKKAAWKNDNDWAAAYERAAVDAQFYARLTDDWYRNTAGFDMVSQACVVTLSNPSGTAFGQIRTVVHYGSGYDNAFWDSDTRNLVFGDGDGFSTGQFSGAEDVVSHELSHRVTECRAPLNYVKQSGALNEAFSDIVATTIEWQTDEPLSSNCRREAGQSGCPDWWVGEDSIMSGSSFGFRNIANPALGNQPGHFANALYVNTNNCNQFNDYCGVHLNSTIPTHAFYLMVNGGRNARCAGPTDPKVDCDVLVPAISLDDAADIAFSAWGMLPNNANFCDAHDASVAAAQLLFPGDNLHMASADLAWSAVGRGSGDCPLPTVPSAPSPNFDLAFDVQSIALKPGGSGQLGLTLTRDQATSSTVSLAVQGGDTAVDQPSPAQSMNNAVETATVQVNVPGDMAAGLYPLVATATSSGLTRYATALLIVDATSPTASVTGVHLPLSGVVSPAGSVSLDVSWTTADDLSGVASASLEMLNGSWVGVDSGIAGTSSVPVAGNTTSFRVVATDVVGNPPTTSAESGPWTLTRSQEGAATYVKTWSALPSTQNFGSVRFSKTINATATFNFSGTEVSWVSTKSPKRGKAKVFVDGVLQATVDLFASSIKDRQIVYTATGLSAGPHTLKIQVVGTTGRPRVDIDGIIALSP